MRMFVLFIVVVWSVSGRAELSGSGNEPSVLPNPPTVRELIPCKDAPCPDASIYNDIVTQGICAPVYEFFDKKYTECVCPLPKERLIRKFELCTTSATTHTLAHFDIEPSQWSLCVALHNMLIEVQRAEGAPVRVLCEDAQAVQ